MAVRFSRGAHARSWKVASRSSRALLKAHPLFSCPAPNPKQFACNLSLSTAVGDAVDRDATVGGVPVFPSHTTSICTADVQRADLVPARPNVVLTPTSTPLSSRKDRCRRIDAAQNNQHGHPSKCLSQSHSSPPPAPDATGWVHRDAMGLQVPLGAEVTPGRVWSGSAVRREPEL